MTGDPERCRPTMCPSSRFAAIPRTAVGRRASCAEPYGVPASLERRDRESLPDAVGAFIHWLINESGWKVAERPSAVECRLVASAVQRGAFSPPRRSTLVPIQARHICLLFRRFVSYDEDMTRPYVQALEARGIPHLLVGGRSFHNRAEIETFRAALAAIEWPDDELSVFATLRGSLFAIGDEELLEYRQLARRFHPFRIPEVTCRPQPGSDCRALRCCNRSIDRAIACRSRRPSALLEATRAHVGFALEHGGEQVLANVLARGRAGAALRSRRRHLVSRVYRRAARAGRERRGGGGPDSRGGQRRRPADDRPQGQGPGVSRRRCLPT